VPIPPPNVPDLEESVNHESHPKTLRAQMELHTSKPFCAGCHKIMDPGSGQKDRYRFSSTLAEKEGVHLPTSATARV
jgi:hypothetical protein